MTVTDLEDVLIERIKNQLPYLATAASYDGQLEGEVKEWAWRYPAVFVAYAEGKDAPDLGEMGGVYGIHFTFDLLVCCRNLRGKAAVRRDPEGAYQILGDLRLALVGQSMGQNLLPIEFLKEDLRLITREIAIYRATYTIPCEWQA